MRKELLGLAAGLSQRGEPFVVAMVVRRESYSSAQQGDMAIITADAVFHGWLGGSCTHSSVQREAARALADGAPRLVSLSTEPDRRPGVTPLPMICLSGGTVEIYIEPVLPAPRLVLFGVTPVVRALAQLGKAMGYGVDVADPEAPAADLPYADRVFTDLGAVELRTHGRAPYTVVASMGRNDEDAVAAALAIRPAYIGVVASRARFAVLRETLLRRGVTAEALDAIRSPAGLDIGPEPAAEEIDPVCNMRVSVATARHIGEWNGRTWYFCNARCKDAFLAGPHRYVDTGSPGAGR